MSRADDSGGERAALAAGALVFCSLMLAGCGGSAGRQPAGRASSGVGSTPAQPAASTTGQSVSKAPSAGGGGDFCAVVRDVAAQAKALNAEIDSASVEEMTKAADRASVLLGKVMARAPKELQAQAKALTDGYLTIMQMMSSSMSLAELAQGRADELMQVHEQIAAAERQVDAYTRQHCGAALFDADEEE